MRRTIHGARSGKNGYGWGCWTRGGNSTPRVERGEQGKQEDRPGLTSGSCVSGKVWCSRRSENGRKQPMRTFDGRTSVTALQIDDNDKDDDEEKMTFGFYTTMFASTSCCPSYC